MDIAMKGKGGNEMKHYGGGNTIEGTLNGGGSEMNISAISGDIFIRKQK
jgi:hypothetical protein